MKKKIIIIISALLLIGIGIFAMSKSKIKTQVYTNLYDEESKKQVLTVLRDNGIRNTQLFEDFLGRFNRAMNSSCGLSKGFEDISQRDYKEDRIAEALILKYPKLNDINCRIVAFSLIKDLFDGENIGKAKDYGTYLMLDVESIERDPVVLPLHKEINKYIALFDEIDISKHKMKGEYKKIYPLEWKKRGIVFKPGNIELISVVIHDPMSDILFIGHTGILVKEKNSLLFVEKLAPSMPFQAARFKDIKELKAELMSRKWYDKEEGALESIIYQNDVVLD